MPIENQCTGLSNPEKFDTVFLEKIESICNSVTAAGLDPYSQLTGYLLIGKDYYITRTGNAREMIASLKKTKTKHM